MKQPVATIAINTVIINSYEKGAKLPTGGHSENVKGRQKQGKRNTKYQFEKLYITVIQLGIALGLGVGEGTELGLSVFSREQPAKGFSTRQLSVHLEKVENHCIREINSSVASPSYTWIRHQGQKKTE